jgi:hypothetical protein
MGFGSSGSYGFGDGGSKEILIGKLEDIKAAPHNGERRLIVREKTGRCSTVAVDIPSEYSSKLERKETYCFSVEEKSDVRNGQGSRMKSSSFRAYHCDDAPSEYTGSEGRGDLLNRFGGSERGGVDRHSRKFMS